jgi:hypothetical protein
MNVKAATTNPLQAPTPVAYTKVEEQLLWNILLGPRGNRRLSLATALVQEAGLSFVEICKLKVNSFDLASQRIAVPSSNGEVSHWTSFGIETLIAYFEWMEVREPLEDGYYGLLLHDSTGDPLNAVVLHHEFVRVLCRSFRGEHLNDVGLDVFTEGRLRLAM